MKSYFSWLQTREGGLHAQHVGKDYQTCNSGAGKSAPAICAVSTTLYVGEVGLG